MRRAGSWATEGLRGDGAGDGLADAEGRLPGLRTLKLTLAAVVAFTVAEYLRTSPQPVLAPLTALLVVRLTMYETLAHCVERVGAVMLGVLVATGVASMAGLTWWSLGLVVALSLAAGLMLRLGPHLLEVPISAMLVLAVGGGTIGNAEQAAAGRVLETAIGAAVAVVVNLVVVPPLHLRPAGAALDELAERLARFLRDLGGDLRSGWNKTSSDRWLAAARTFGDQVHKADHTLTRAEESARLNPRAAKVRQVQPRLRAGLTGLELCQVTLRSLCRALQDRAYNLPSDAEPTAYREDARRALADVMDATADAVALIPTGLDDDEVDRVLVDRQLTTLRRHRDKLSDLLLVDPRADQSAWQQHGALLAAVDRLRVEVATTLRPVVVPDVPDARRPLGVREQALRRVTAARPRLFAARR